MADRIKVRSERKAGQNFDLLESEGGVDDVYVDGFAGITFSVTTVKVEMYSFLSVKVEDDTPIEQRELKFRLVMPTNNWLDMCAKALQSMHTNETKVREAINRYTENLQSYLPPTAPEKEKSEN